MNQYNNKKTIGFFSTSRAEFGLFGPLIKQIEGEVNLSYKLFIGGAHLKENFGSTIKEAEKFKITDTFDFLSNKDDEKSLVNSMGKEFHLLSEIFSKYDFDFVCVLGDRFELIPIVHAAIIYKKPIIHIHGGEVTEGAIDEQIRHMITKASHSHFTACAEYSENIRKMGEEDWRIFNTGALGVDNILNNKKISEDALFNELDLDKKKKTILLTYHPVTLEYKIEPIKQLENLFDALSKFDFQIVITSPNIEVDREKINSFIKKKVSKNRDYCYVESLGVVKYHSLISFCEFVIGNSSSGIIEVPFFKLPTVNIGDRQKGRLRHPSIIDTDYTVKSIENGIEKALSENFRQKIKGMKYKFGNGHAAENMAKAIKSIEINEKLMRKKLDFSGKR